MDFDDSMDLIGENSHDELIRLAHTNDEFSLKCHKLANEVESTLDYVFMFDSCRIHSAMARKYDTRISVDVGINPVDLFVDGYVGRGKNTAEYWPGGKFGYNEKSIGELV